MWFFVIVYYEPTPISVLRNPSNTLPDVEPELLVASFDPSGNATFCNEAWESILGPQPTPWTHLNDSDRNQAVEAVTRAASGSLATHQIVDADTSLRDEPVPVLLNFIPVHVSDENDTPDIGAVTVSGEMMAEPPSWTTSQTERHRFEALGRMTMGIVHDLNNLLSGLFGHIELLQQTSETESLDEEALTSLRTIENVAQDGAALIDKLQQFIRQDRQVRFSPIDLTSLLEDCIAMTQPYWYNEPRRQGIAIELERDLQDVPTVMGDESELREVIVNLILNAVQAMPDGGTLQLRTYSPHDSEVHLEVADTGEGMSEEVQRRIFEPLFTTKGEHGTGMGLPVSYGIIQKHHGDINVESTPGEGTRFQITLPPATDAPDDEGSDEQPTRDATSAKVLIVDDEEMVRSVFTKLLSLNGHDVLRAASAPEALDMIADNRPDIVFTDQGMSEMSGTELAKQLQDTHPKLPVVLVTGDTEVSEANGLVEAIVDKPFKLDELEQLIRQHVG